MKRFTFVLTASLLLSVVACNKTDTKMRYIFLSAKYQLNNIAFSAGGKIPGGPAHFNEYTDLEPCDDLLDKTNCFVTFHVEVNNKIPYGYGSLDLSFVDTSIPDKHFDFSYVVLYDKVYGGEPIQTNGTKPDVLGRQQVRGNYWWYRAEFFLPEVDNKRVITEFHVIEKYAEPVEFDERYN